MIVRTSLLAAAAALTSCSVDFRVREVDPLGHEMDGIPIRVRSAHMLSVFQLQKDNTYKEVFVTQEEMADVTKLYSLNFCGSTFADASIKVDLNADSSLKNAEIEGESKADEAIGALATQVKNTSDAFAELETARREKEKAEADRAKEEADKQAAAEASLVAFYEANAAAEVAYETYQEALANGDLPESELEALRWDFRVKALKANQAAAKIGLAKPYRLAP